MKPPKVDCRKCNKRARVKQLDGSGFDYLYHALCECTGCDWEWYETFELVKKQWKLIPTERPYILRSLANDLRLNG